MPKKSSPKLNLTLDERKRLRTAKIKIEELLNFAADELEVILKVDTARVKTILALAEFQTAPSVGVKFAEDLIFMGYYTLGELKGKDGATLLDEFERKKGYWTDPCVEDQFRLIVDFAEYPAIIKNWWDYSETRKNYRMKFSYPEDRPKTAWHEVIPINWKTKK
jgi:hypothetical protein